MEQEEQVHASQQPIQQQVLVNQEEHQGMEQLQTFTLSSSTTNCIMATVQKHLDHDGFLGHAAVVLFWWYCQIGLWALKKVITGQTHTH